MSYNIEVPFEFRGEGKVYFRIWVVNAFLSIITLGVYSAWAKVRSNRYFYSHLSLDGTSFEYLANPVSILKGRVLAVVLFFSYTLVSRFTPDLSWWFLALLVPVVPWLMLKSLQFRARNSVYRNIRFHFHGNYPRAFLVMGIYPALIFGPFALVGLYFEHATPSEDSLDDMILAAMALGISAVVAMLFLAFVLQRYFNFVVSNSSYGQTPFEFRSSVKEYSGLVGKIFLAILALGLASSAITWMSIWYDSREFTGNVLPAITTLFSLGFYFALIAIFAAGTTNLLYNGIVIPGWYTFRSTVSSWGLFKVYVINTILIVLTLGFYIPFAKIRMINYRISRMRFVSTVPLDNFIFDRNDEVAAFGQEMGEMFDLGLSL